MIKKILIALLVVLVLIQFIRPERNEGSAAGANQISQHYTVPDQVAAVLKTSCYDCHSNNTKYPWYTDIQPVGLWLQSHVNDGKRHLNFDEFGSYSEKKAKHQFEEIEDAMTNGWMPLAPYLWIHSDAKLTVEQAKAVGDWAAALK